MQELPDASLDGPSAGGDGGRFVDDFIFVTFDFGRLTILRPTTVTFRRYIEVQLRQMDV